MKSLSVSIYCFRLLIILAVSSAFADDKCFIGVGGTSEISSLEDALDRVAEIRKGDTNRSIIVTIAEGDYTPAQMLRIDARHARRGWAPLVLRAAGAKRPRIIGGAAVRGWKKTPFNGRTDVWSADLASIKQDKPFNLFFCNGRKMEVARFPNANPAKPYTSGFSFAVNQMKKVDGREVPDGLFENTIQISEANDHAWKNPSEGRILVWPRHNWWNRTYELKSYDSKKRMFETSASHKEIVQNLFVWDRYILLGLREELDAPGEWYLDFPAKKLYFIPPAGVDLSRAVTSVPRYTAVVEVSGAANLSLLNLEITCGSTGVTIHDADQVVVRGCHIHDIGFHNGNGVTIHGHRCVVADCDIWNIGASGIFVHSIPNESAVKDRLGHVIENNYVHHCGQVNSHGIGIWIGGQGVRVSHNLIHDMPRCGIFGYGRFCELSYNRIRHVNTVNDDTGAIYGGGWTCGTGSKVCYNHISESIGFQRQRDGRYVINKGACGIYPDEGCGGLSVYGNLVEHCHHAAMHLHNGRWITISNNVFISNCSIPVSRNSKQLSLQTWNSDTNGYFVKVRRAAISKQYHKVLDRDPGWRAYPAFAQAPDEDAKTFLSDGTTMMGVQVKNNIFYYPDQAGSVLLSGWKVNTVSNPFDNNVYWPGPGTNVLMNTVHKDFDAWRTAGQDLHSLVADPLFRDVSKGDYRLRPDSPARACGFVDLPYDRMGLMTTDFRPVLPVEAEGVREHPEWLVE